MFGRERAGPENLAIGWEIPKKDNSPKEDTVTLEKPGHKHKLILCCNQDPICVQHWIGSAKVDTFVVSNPVPQKEIQSVTVDYLDASFSVKGTKLQLDKRMQYCFRSCSRVPLIEFEGIVVISRVVYEVTK